MTSLDTTDVQTLATLGLLGNRRRYNPASIVAGIGTLAGGALVMTGGIIAAVGAPPAATLTGTYATDTPAVQAAYSYSAFGGPLYTANILSSIGGGLLIVGGGAEVVAGF